MGTLQQCNLSLFLRTSASHTTSSEVSVDVLTTARDEILFLLRLLLFRWFSMYNVWLFF